LVIAEGKTAPVTGTDCALGVDQIRQRIARQQGDLYARSMLTCTIVVLRAGVEIARRHVADGRSWSIAHMTITLRSLSRERAAEIEVIVG
jgi:hypothetical protein